MRILRAFVLSMLIGLTLLPQAGAAPQFGQGRERIANTRDRVCFYKDSEYNGWEQCYNVGDEVRSMSDKKAQASSIRIFGRAGVIVYDSTDFEGRVTEFYQDVSNLALRAASGGHTWNDRISSLVVVSDSYVRGSRGGSPSGGPSYGNESRRNPQGRLSDGICVYSERDFRGRSECWGAGEQIRDLNRAGNWSDRISSIEVLGRATVVLYRDVDFFGESIVINQDIPDLSRVPGRGFRNWDRQISSLQIEDDRNGNGRFGRGRARGRF